MGAPVGSVLLGDEDFIRKARRIRKVMGGGMRQAGILAAAGIYALNNNVNRLVDDHQRARTLAEALKEMPYVESIKPVYTNLVMLQLKDAYDTDWLTEQLAAHHIKTIGLDKQEMRLVTHLDIYG